MHADSIGRYRIVKELGRGAMGRVFLGHDPDIDRPVAIKTVQVFASLPDGERREARERFVREARAAGRLMHPGIVTLFDVGEHERVPFLAMEFVEGDTLDRFCRGDRLLPPETAVELAAKVAEALDYAHRNDIVHRDIKPANIMRVGETDAKVMDFGLATAPASQMSQDSVLFGTPSYMSPEQIRGETVDGRTDLFALGCVLFELLTGEKAFGGDSISSVVYRIVHETPADDAGSRIPEVLRAVLERALAKDPADRFATGAEFAEALRSAMPREDAAAEPGAPSVATVAAVTPGDSSEIPPAPVRNRRRRSGGAFIAVAVVIVAALAFAGWHYRDRIESLLSRLQGGPSEAVPAAAPAVAAGRTYTATVRTDPPGLPVLLNGEPFDSDVVEFRGEGPYGVLKASQACREVVYEIGLADAGGEIVLVPDPIEVEVSADPGVAGAAVLLNGAEVGVSPVPVVLDLCSENVLEARAERFRPALLTLTGGSTPIEARAALADWSMEPIPYGTLTLPRTSLKVAYHVDGRRVEGRPKEIEIEEGAHKLRVVSKNHWIDITVPVTVRAGESVSPLPTLPALAELRVQSFPPNCRVSLRRAGQDWRFLANTPVGRSIAAGEYQIRIERTQTGEVREQDLTLRSGPNPPVRISFGGSG